MTQHPIAIRPLRAEDRAANRRRRSPRAEGSPTEPYAVLRKTRFNVLGTTAMRVQLRMHKLHLAGLDLR